MKKIAFALMIIFVLSGCDSVPDGVVDVELASYKVSEIDAPSVFVYTTKDSIINHSIFIKDTEKISKVTYKLMTYNGQVLESEEMLFKGDISKHDKEYYAETSMSIQDYSGYYEFRYYVTDNLGKNSENTKEVVAHKFYYLNGQDNIAPVISDLKVYYSDENSVLREKVERDKDIIYSIKVTDVNGYSDIKNVNFTLHRPDGSFLGEIKMFDDGDPKHGDVKAGDGIYSLMNSFGSTAALGTWKFEFYAKDQSGEVSNKIEHKLVLE